MKTIVNVYDYNIESSKNFENNIAKIVNNKLAECGAEPAMYIDIYLAGMTWEGRGQYKEVMEVEIDNIPYYIRKHSTDSQSYDDLKDTDVNPTTYNNHAKRFALSLLQKGVDGLVEEILQNRL